MKLHDSVRYRQEVVTAARYYADLSPALALRFLTALDQARLRAARSPRAFRNRGGGIRAVLLGRFPYRLRFELRPTGRELWFLSLSHTARKTE